MNTITSGVHNNGYINKPIDPIKVPQTDVLEPVMETVVARRS